MGISSWLLNCSDIERNENLCYDHITSPNLGQNWKHLSISALLKKYQWIFIYLSDCKSLKKALMGEGGASEISSALLVLFFVNIRCCPNNIYIYIYIYIYVYIYINKMGVIWMQSRKQCTLLVISMMFSSSCTSSAQVCMSWQEVVVVITGRAHCFHDCIHKHIQCINTSLI